MNSVNNNKSLQGDSATFINLKKENQSGSPIKMIDEQKKKVFLQKKNEMLKNFEVPK